MELLCSGQHLGAGLSQFAFTLLCEAKELLSSACIPAHGKEEKEHSRQVAWLLSWKLTQSHTNRCSYVQYGSELANPQS